MFPTTAGTSIELLRLMHVEPYNNMTAFIATARTRCRARQKRNIFYQAYIVPWPAPTRQGYKGEGV